MGVHGKQIALERGMRSLGKRASIKQSAGGDSYRIVDNRPEAITQNRWQEVADSSPQVSRLEAFQNMVTANPLPRAPTLQRWPDITTPSGTFTYELGRDFQVRHMAESQEAAMHKARSLYDPNHTEGSHSAYVTVVYGDISGVSVGTDARVNGPYHWALSIDIDAVCMGPSGLRGAAGDPGQMDDSVSSVTVSGYGQGTTDNPARITHVTTSL